MQKELTTFSKMHGLGNDFMVIDNTKNNIHLSSAQIQALGDRNFGIGFDQLLQVETNTTGDADFNYIIYNADGTQVEQCGNGARCFAHFVFAKGLTAKKTITAKTLSGIITLHINDDNSVVVDMGSPNFEPSTIIHSHILQDYYHIANFEMGLVSMGNPHAIIITDKELDVPCVGKIVQQAPEFINSVNVGFVQIIDQNNIKLRVFERGVGETLACGSGACASIAFTHKMGLTSNNVDVKLRGGVANVVIKNRVLLTASANFVFDGVVDLTNVISNT